MSINSLLTNIPIINSLGQSLNTQISIPFDYAQQPVDSPLGVVTPISNSSAFNKVGMVDITLSFTMTNFSNNNAFVEVGTIDGYQPPNQKIIATCSVSNADIQSFGIIELDVDGKLSILNVVEFPTTSLITVAIHLVYLY